MAAACGGARSDVPVPDQAGKPAARSTLRLLLVDDHRVVRRGLLAFLVGEPGIEVVGEAADGRQAVDMARQLRPDVILMDVSMPVMDGIEATRLIKAELPATRVVGLSMFAQPEVPARMKQAGAAACLSKTAPPAAILEAIIG